jgi:hypothetical protein
MRVKLCMPTVCAGHAGGEMVCGGHTSGEAVCADRAACAERARALSGHVR